MPNLKVHDTLNRIQILQAGQHLTDFCQRVGLNYENIKKCNYRNSLPDSESLSKIAEYFHLDLRWLISGTEPTSSLNQMIAKKILDIRMSRGWSQEALAEKIPLSPIVLDLYEKGKCRFSTDLIQHFSKALEVHPCELLTDEGPLLFQSPQLNVLPTSSLQKTPRISSEDFISIPLTESAIAAGLPIIPQENIEEYVLLHIRAAGKCSNLVASRVDGHSMEPMLHPGDIVVIDRDDKRIMKNRIFAIYHEGGLTAKYLEQKNNLLILRPINPNAEVQIIYLNENPQPIVGKIIGAWKDL